MRQRDSYLYPLLSEYIRQVNALRPDAEHGHLQRGTLVAILLLNVSATSLQHHPTIITIFSVYAEAWHFSLPLRHM